ncbi:MAG: DUF3365 domain-containing protein [Planctomycetales bacterium]|nr:DUF3365 domain-containing protein [Planctomycetales bacterium]
MNSRFCTILCAVAAATGVMFVTLSLCAEPPSDVTNQPKHKQTSVPIKPSDRMSVAAARERAKLMHDIYDSTLDVMHRRFFRREQSVLPARAMEDIFAEMASKTSTQARWISVNTKAMSIHHEPETEFEKQAAKVIAAGKADFELVEKGYYQRVGRISLGGGCVGCHTDQFASPSTSPKFAGLVIRIPVNDE